MTRNLTRIALLVALALALHTVEGMLPALPVPGARLGLANMATVIALGVLGPGQALLVATLRAVVGGMVVGTFLAPAFFMSLAGSVVSAAAMIGVRRVAGSGLSLVGVSLVGALVHNLAQLGVAAVIIGYAVVSYLPYLILFAVPAGLVTGAIASVIVDRLQVVVSGGGGGSCGDA